ncbi:MAG: dolichyl-phosphate beta-glucosyltransferase [Candidatus Uhrbacteria bacterium]
MIPINMVFSIIIPAFNEARTIEKAVRETVRIFDDILSSYEIIVVDDGSTDATVLATKTLVKNFSCVRLIEHKTNKGKGAAVKTGILAAKGTWALFLDADLATHPSQFRKFLPALKSHDIIIGSRRLIGARIAERQPFYRIWAGRAFNLFIHWYLDIRFQDTQCGFKAFHRRTFPLFRTLHATGWTFDVELLLRAQEEGFAIQEIPVTWRHGRESRVHLSDIWKILRELHTMKE